MPSKSVPPGGPVKRAFFESPSKNIGCEIEPGTVRCDIGQFTWKLPPKPADCEFDWGGSLRVERTGPGHLICVSDAARSSDSTVLGYGKKIRRGAFVCSSATKGVTCDNSATKHGFFISKQIYRTY